jgi:hypothetical protein
MKSINVVWIKFCRAFYFPDNDSNMNNNITEKDYNNVHAMDDLHFIRGIVDLCVFF